MSRIGDWMQESAHDVRVAAESDVVVVGGGPAGLAAALAAARNGASVTLLERYNHLGGLASGGMVLVLDDMWDSHQQEISVRGICLEMIERMAALGLAEYPQAERMGQRCPNRVRRWKRWGTFDFHSKEKPHPICFAAAFDPDAWKRVSLEMVAAGRHRAAPALVVLAHAGRRRPGQGRGLRDQERPRSDPGQGGDRRHRRPRRRGIGRRAAHQRRLHRDDGVPPGRRRHRRSRALRARGARGLRRRSTARSSTCSAAPGTYWWLKTPLPGVVWCNCPHMAGLDGLKVDGPDARRDPGPQHHPQGDRVRPRQAARLRATATWSTWRRRPASARPACSKAST